MEHRLAAVHGGPKGVPVRQIAHYPLDGKPIQHPGWARGAVEGPHVPASVETGPDEIVANAAGGAKHAD
jgi:hypothetical protein